MIKSVPAIEQLAMNLRNTTRDLSYDTLMEAAAELIRMNYIIEGLENLITSNEDFISRSDLRTLLTTNCDITAFKNEIKTILKNTLDGYTGRKLNYYLQNEIETHAMIQLASLPLPGYYKVELISCCSLSPGPYFEFRYLDDSDQWQTLNLR